MILCGVLYTCQHISVADAQLSLDRCRTTAWKVVQAQEQQASLLPQLRHKEGQPHL